jgi:hypothetical protein
MLRVLVAIAKMVAWVAYAIVGLIQITATASGIQHLTGLWWLVCWFIALLIGWMPLLGTGLGIYGAYADWNWSLALSILLFVGVPGFFICVALIATAVSTAMERRRR